MAKQQIKGKQIKDDTITGEEIDESSLVMPTVYYSSGNHTSTNVTYLAIPGRNGWSTSFTKNNIQLIAAYNGKVTKVFLRPTTADNINASLFQVRTNQDGNTCEDGATNVVTTSLAMTVGVDEGTTEITFGSPISIPKGHAFCFAILKMSAGGYGITDAAIVIEWDLGS